MASPRNPHCANCIDTLSFPTARTAVCSKCADLKVKSRIMSVDAARSLSELVAIVVDDDINVGARVSRL